MHSSPTDSPVPAARCLLLCPHLRLYELLPAQPMPTPESIGSALVETTQTQITVGKSGVKRAQSEICRNMRRSNGCEVASIQNGISYLHDITNSKAVHSRSQGPQSKRLRTLSKALTDSTEISYSFPNTTPNLKVVKHLCLNFEHRPLSSALQVDIPQDNSIAFPSFQAISRYRFLKHTRAFFNSSPSVILKDHASPEAEHHVTIMDDTLQALKKSMGNTAIQSFSIRSADKDNGSLPNHISAVVDHSSKNVLEDTTKSISFRRSRRSKADLDLNSAVADTYSIPKGLKRIDLHGSSFSKNDVDFTQRVLKTKSRDKTNKTTDHRIMRTSNKGGVFSHTPSLPVDSDDESKSSVPLGIALGEKSKLPHISVFFKRASVLMGKLQSVKALTVRDRKCVRDTSNHLLTHSIHKGGIKSWGKASLCAEAIWDGIPELTKLYSSKKYLVEGLHCSSKVKKGQSDRYRLNKDFSFPLPIHFGDRILNMKKDFELPHDLKCFVDIFGGVQQMKEMYYGNEANLFVHIEKNVWVDRRPLDVPLDFESICQCKTPGDGYLPCGEDCINRCLFIECGDNCPMGALCANRAFKRGEEISQLKVLFTPNRGYGLYTDVPITSGCLIVEYRGEIISTTTCIERMNTTYLGQHNQYFLDYGSGLVLDGCRKGTVARFANHSCDPNCHVEKWYVGHEFRVGIFATNNISAGTELTYDYRFDSYGPMQPCLCGAQNCRGFIGVNKKTGTATSGTKAKSQSIEVHTSHDKSATTESQLSRRAARIARQLDSQAREKQEQQENRELAVHGRAMRAHQRH
ncbi:hypothetical protein BSLG_010334 [Batrachochytrium salamandrivorans]|nr:hypothetical protein BSLG_010334 [Batrachochytrium salamandrivorans]